MPLRHKILALAGVVTLFGATLASAMGQNVAESTVSVTIVGGGPLVASISASPAAAMQQPGGMTFENLTINVLDKRGLATGWSVFMSVKPDAGPARSPAIAFWPRVITVNAGNSDLSGHAVIDCVSGSTRSATLWSTANHFGDGAYALGITSTSTSPGDSPQEVHTLIVSIRGAAP